MSSDAQTLYFELPDGTVGMLRVEEYDGPFEVVVEVPEGAVEITAKRGRARLEKQLLEGEQRTERLKAEHREWKATGYAELLALGMGETLAASLSGHREGP